MNLSEKIVEHLDRINNYFNLNLRQTNRSFTGCCPIHGGDNPTALTIYTTGYDRVGVWRCFTHDCHKKYGANAIGFIRGILSRKNRKLVEFAEAVKWCENFLSCKFDMKPPEDNEILTSVITRLGRERPEPPFRLTREQFLGTLSPTNYFIKRGYKAETLKKFDVGYCANPSKRFYNRVVVPQYDDEGKYIIGAIARSIYEKCQICKYFHDPNGPCKHYAKWINSDNFPSEWALYNFHRAKKFINETGIAILIESAGDTWRIDEADFPMALGTFGSKFSEEQKRLLDTTACNTVVVVPNNGDAGQILVEHIREQCKRTHNIVIVEPKYKDDIGACNIEAVKQILGPIIDKHGY